MRTRTVLNLDRQPGEPAKEIRSVAGFTIEIGIPLPPPRRTRLTGHPGAARPRNRRINRQQKQLAELANGKAHRRIGPEIHSPRNRRRTTADLAD